MSSNFVCLYCGGTDYLAFNHWKVCTMCPHNQQYLSRAVRVKNALALLDDVQARRESLKKRRGIPKPRPYV